MRFLITIRNFHDELPDNIHFHKKNDSPKEEKKKIPMRSKLIGAE